MYCQAQTLVVSRGELYAALSIGSMVGLENTRKKKLR